MNDPLVWARVGDGMAIIAIILGAIALVTSVLNDRAIKKLAERVMPKGEFEGD